MCRNLCIDIGSTKIKYALFENGRRTSEGSLPFPPPVRAEGYFYEVSAPAVAAAVKAVIRAFPSAENVLFSVQMHGHVLSVRKDIYVSWRDKRSLDGGLYEKLKMIYGEAFSPESGTVSKPNLAVYGMLADLAGGAEVSGEFYSLGSYIVSELTGRNVSHATDLCATGFFLADGVPNEQLLSSLPFSLVLPRCMLRMGKCGIFEGKRIFAPAGDQQCSVAALGEEERAVLNVGTAAQICRVRKGFVRGRFESRPFFGKRTLCTKTGLPGGAELRSRPASALKEEMINKYGEAFRDVGAQGEVVCTGGAFAFYGDMLFEVVRAAGLTPVYKDSDALDGLNLLFGR